MTRISTCVSATMEAEARFLRARVTDPVPASLSKPKICSAPIVSPGSKTANSIGSSSTCWSSNTYVWELNSAASLLSGWWASCLPLSRFLRAFAFRICFCVAWCLLCSHPSWASCATVKRVEFPALGDISSRESMVRWLRRRLFSSVCFAELCVDEMVGFARLSFKGRPLTTRHFPDLTIRRCWKYDPPGIMTLSQL